MTAIQTAPFKWRTQYVHHIQTTLRDKCTKTNNSRKIHPHPNNAAHSSKRRSSHPHRQKRVHLDNVAFGQHSVILSYNWEPHSKPVRSLGRKIGHTRRPNPGYRMLLHSLIWLRTRQHRKTNSGTAKGDCHCLRSFVLHNARFTWWILWVYEVLAYS